MLESSSKERVMMKGEMITAASYDEVTSFKGFIK